MRNVVAHCAHRRDLVGEGVPHGQGLVEMACKFVPADANPSFRPYVGPARFTTLETDEARDAAKATGVGQVTQQLAKLDAHLVGRTHFVSNSNTLADATLAPM